MNELVPALGPAPTLTQPATDDRVLPSGLRVIAVRRGGVPLVELRLRLPCGSTEPGHTGRTHLLAQTLFAGTAHHDRLELAERAQELGATLTVSADPDHLLISGQVLAPYLDQLLHLLAESLDGASYPDDEVQAELQRLCQRLRVARAQASVQARETLHRHLFDGHPYGRELPDVAEVAQVSADGLRALHADVVVAAGATLVLVGDLEPHEAGQLTAAALAGWTRTAATEPAMPQLPRLAADPSLLVHRPGSVQSSIRIGGPALPRDHPRFAALQLANLIYGGYFSSRLVANIREDKGYTYSPRSWIDHGCAGSTLVVEADVATEVTAPALLEMWYELGRLSTLRPTPQELDDVRQYATGTLAMSVATQAGLATTLVLLAAAGLDLQWVSDHPARLAQVNADDIYDMGVHILAPCRLAAVVIGDATETAEPLKAFGPWEVRR